MLSSVWNSVLSWDGHFGSFQKEAEEGGKELAGPKGLN